MNDVVIRAEGLGKTYVLGAERERYVALRDVVARAGAKVASDVRAAFLRTAAKSPVDSAAASDEFWALRDINFEITRGQVVGVVGRNGAGKSTLLKLLSRITEPTLGRIELRGRVASLLEVGTGFHPELTGRENIFLNGAILGMTRAEIARKFDEIVDFAGVERFLDTPVKRYSSGMYVRLAFAVAAHLEPEILIVDEVLAVGDAEFQKKCLGRMQEVSSSGRTVLFVSHNIGALLATCGTGLLLDQGHLIATGQMPAIASQYRALGYTGQALSARAFEGPLKSVNFESLAINGVAGFRSVAVRPSEELTIRVTGRSSEDLSDLRFAVALYIDDLRLATVSHGPVPIRQCGFAVTFVIPPEVLRPGAYSIAVGATTVRDNNWCWGRDLVQIEVAEDWTPSFRKEDLGYINLKSVRSNYESDDLTLQVGAA